jgi:thioredoxin reductase (NADPH)
VADRAAVRFRHGRIDDATSDRRPPEPSLSTGDTVQPRAPLVATGGERPRRVGAENEADLMDQGLPTYPTWDGAFHRGDDVLVRVSATPTD